MSATYSTTNAPVTIAISGEPVPKGRARMTRKGFIYTPSHTRKYEAFARLTAQHAMGDRPPIIGPVRIELLVELPIPQSWSQRKKAAAITGSIRPVGRPDLDNFTKALFDAINTLVICDDAQIVELRAVKRYSASPKMVASVFALDATT
jgi:Holliday junction resolvase RusA-like endonuclease